MRTSLIALHSIYKATADSSATTQNHQHKSAPAHYRPKPTRNMPHTALIIVDVQNDFLPPSGSLAVPGGRQVIPVIQKLLDRSWKWDTVIASQVGFPHVIATHRSTTFEG